MIEVKGKYNSAKVFTDAGIEDNLSDQIKDILNMEIYSQNKIRIMPDTHWGSGCPIGLTMNITDAITANFVGVDISCGMLTVEFNGDNDFERLDQVIRSRIPSGFNVRNNPHVYAEELEDKIKKLNAIKNFSFQRAMNSIGTLGGGNHMIEVGQNESGKYLVIHSGSRNMGLKVANFHQSIAIQNMKKEPLRKREEKIQEMKDAGRHSEIGEFLNEWRKNYKGKIPNALAWLEGDDFDAYIDDMKVCQKYASSNRRAMADIIGNEMGWTKIGSFETVHNYIDTDEMILRKGAVSAKKGERLIIPINMRDGCILAVGKGNDEWNNSSPHGAGRVLGRKQAHRKLESGEFTMDQFENEMKDVFTTSVKKATIDESPMAYKKIDYILRNIKDTVDIEGIIKPIYNFKAS